MSAKIKINVNTGPNTSCLWVLFPDFKFFKKVVKLINHKTPNNGMTTKSVINIGFIPTFPNGKVLLIIVERTLIEC